jgi:hypothetical protein
MPTDTETGKTSKQSVDSIPPNAEPVSEQPTEELAPKYSVFTTWEKRCIVLGAALAAFFSPLTAQIYLPALNLLAIDFNITEAQANLTVTTYMVCTCALVVTASHC